MGPVLCPPFVSIPSKDPFNFQPQCPSINCLCSVLGGVLQAFLMYRECFSLSALTSGANLFSSSPWAFLIILYTPSTSFCNRPHPSQHLVFHPLPVSSAMTFIIPLPPSIRAPGSLSIILALPKPCTSGILLPSAPTCMMQDKRVWCRWVHPRTPGQAPH